MPKKALINDGKDAKKIWEYKIYCKNVMKICLNKPRERLEKLEGYKMLSHLWRKF